MAKKNNGKEKYVEMKDFYAMKNVFYLDEISRWSYIVKNAKQNDISLKIDTALHTIEKNNKALKGALPEFCKSASFEDIKANDFSLVPSKYIEFVDRDSGIDFDTEMKRIQKDFRELLQEEKKIASAIDRCI